MTKTEMRAIINDQPFINGIKPEYLDILVSHASNPHFKHGHFLLTQGNKANTFYIIVRGKVAIQSNNDGNDAFVVQVLESGELVGTSWLVPPNYWQFDALVLEDTNVISFDGKKIRQLCEQDHAFGYDMLKRITCVITYRLVNTRTKLMDCYVS